MSTMPSLTGRAHATRESLVEVARAVFEKDGYDGASISQIVEDANVSRGTFYLYFDSKEAVFREVVDRLQQKILAAQNWPEITSGQEVIRSAIRQFLIFYRENARMMAVLEQTATHSPEFLQLRLEMRRGTARGGRRLIESLRRSGEVDSDVDSEYAANALNGMIDRFAYVWFVLEEDFEMDKAVDVLTELWYRAIGGTYRPAADSVDDAVLS